MFIVNNKVSLTNSTGGSSLPQFEANTTILPSAPQHPFDKWLGSFFSFRIKCSKSVLDCPQHRFDEWLKSLFTVRVKSTCSVFNYLPRQPYRRSCVTHNASPYWQWSCYWSQNRHSCWRSQRRSCQWSIGDIFTAQKTRDNCRIQRAS